MATNADKKFPDGFLWGSSTSAYQVEGGIVNTDWNEAARQGILPDPGRADDHYHLFEKDFDIAVELGHNAHRFSIEWARIEPEEGVFDERAIEHYKLVFDALEKRHLTPAVTLWHFTVPLWFDKSGGFLRKDAATIFSRYCEYVLDKLGNRSKMWMTMNEPMIWTQNAYFNGNWPPFHNDLVDYLRVINVLAAAHKKVYQYVQAKKMPIQLGVAKNNMYFDSNRSPFNRMLVWFLDWFWNRRFLNKIKGHQDFIALNQYFYKRFGEPRPILPRSDMGWEVYPRSLYLCLMELKRYNLPVYVMENGIADAADTKRAAFIKEATMWAHKALEDGVPLKGYFYWSLLDNFEWDKGFDKRFGLVEVQYDTMKRIIRPSALVFKEICQGNALFI